jgi:hypothetical protein
MCTDHTERVEVAGSGKGPAQGPSARVAVGLGEESARAFAGAILAALDAADSVGSLP